MSKLVMVLNPAGMVVEVKVEGGDGTSCLLQSQTLTDKINKGKPTDPGAVQLEPEYYNQAMAEEQHQTI